MSNKDEIKRIYRSKEDKMIAGVCGGIAEYFEVDSVWVRLGAVLSVFMSGIGLLLYIVAWIIIPENPNQKDRPKTASEKIVTESAMRLKNTPKKSKKITKKSNDGKFLGGLLILIGSYFLLDKYFPFFDVENFWPVLLIFFGIYLLSKGNKNGKK